MQKYNLSEQGSELSDEDNLNRRNATLGHASSARAAPPDRAGDPIVSGLFRLALKTLLRTLGLLFNLNQFTKENGLSLRNRHLSIWTQNALREAIRLKIRIPAVPNPRHLDLIRATPDILQQPSLTRKNQNEEKR